MRSERAQRRSERVVDRLTKALGSVGAVVAHVVAFALWVIWNLGALPGLRPIDEAPVTHLAAFASLESIVLTLLVLVAQNRLAWVEQRQNELDLQINLLAEHEITQLLELTAAIAAKLEIPRPSAIEELRRDVHPQAVLDEIDKASRNE